MKSATVQDPNTIGNLLPAKNNTPTDLHVKQTYRRHRMHPIASPFWITAWSYVPSAWRSFAASAIVVCYSRRKSALEKRFGFSPEFHRMVRDNYDATLTSCKHIHIKPDREYSEPNASPFVSSSTRRSHFPQIMVANLVNTCHYVRYLEF